MIKQPASRNCFVCGRENPFGLKMDFYADVPGEVTATFKISDNFEGFPGVVHGGIIAALLDEGAGRAHMTDPRKFMMTAQLNVRYRKPVPTGVKLTLKGFAGERKGRVAKATGEIRDENGTLLAEAEGVFVDIPHDKLETMNAYSLGWRVYPDAEEEK